MVHSGLMTASCVVNYQKIPDTSGQEETWLSKQLKGMLYHLVEHIVKVKGRFGYSISMLKEVTKLVQQLASYRDLQNLSSNS